jgi:hypothetical protein
LASSPYGLVFEDAMEVVFGSTFVQLNEMPDEEATAVLKMTVDFAKFVKEPSGGSQWVQWIQWVCVKRVNGHILRPMGPEMGTYDML